MDRAKQNRKLIDRHNGQWLSFDKLPEAAKNSAIIYQFGSGSVWGKVGKEEIEEARKELRERTAGKKWGYALIPTTLIKTLVMKFGKEEIGHSDFDSFHKWYLLGGVPNHKTADWPLILSGFDDEFIQDGWHRLNCYVKQNRKEIPVLLFP